MTTENQQRVGPAAGGWGATNDRKRGLLDRYETLALTRTDTGVLTVRFHTDGGPAAFSGPMQRELPRALAEIAEDIDNNVLVLTAQVTRS